MWVRVVPICNWVHLNNLEDIRNKIHSCRTICTQSRNIRYRQCSSHSRHTQMYIFRCTVHCLIIRLNFGIQDNCSSKVHSRWSNMWSIANKSCTIDRKCNRWDRSQHSHSDVRSSFICMRNISQIHPALWSICRTVGWCSFNSTEDKCRWSRCYRTTGCLSMPCRTTPQLE